MRLLTLVVSIIFLVSFSFSVNMANSMSHEEKMKEVIETPEEVIDEDDEKMGMHEKMDDEKMGMHEKAEDISDEEMRPVSKEWTKEEAEEKALEEEIEKEGK